MQLVTLSDDTLLRRVHRLEIFAMRCARSGDPQKHAQALLASERATAARAELLRRYPA